MSEACTSGSGFLAVSIAEGVDGPDLRNVEKVLGEGATTQRAVGKAVTRVGRASATRQGDGVVVDLLSQAPRRRDHAMDADDVATLLSDQRPFALQEVLPPFAAVRTPPGSDPIVGMADSLGYRHLYTRVGRGWAAMSTSARALAACEPAGIDRGGVGMQALLGWQVGLKTPFAQVLKLPPGAVARLERGRLVVDGPEPSPAQEEALPLAVAVERAASVLRSHVSAVLDDHPDVTLQLTGGQDSRVLLGAIDPLRRRGMRVMTVASPGNPDAEIAAQLAQRYGMRHEVIDLSGLAGLTPEDAHAMAVAAGRRLDCSANPIASAAIAWAESQIDQHPRLAGLGGEVARGFYYLGPFRDVPVTRDRVRRLTEWRMFTNESVSESALAGHFGDQARAEAVDTLHSLFASRGASWFAATDEFYLLERMHRWSGVVASTTAMERATFNPMLDDRFLTLARGLHPRDKQNSLFLSMLSCALDGELSKIPLDGRPSPEIYARPTYANRLRIAASTGRKISGKVVQKLSRTGRPPAGADLLAPKITEYFRASPTTLDPIRKLNVLSPQWLDAVARGSTPLDPGSCSMLVNLEVLADAVAARPFDQFV